MHLVYIINACFHSVTCFFFLLFGITSKGVENDSGTKWWRRRHLGAGGADVDVSAAFDMTAALSEGPLGRFIKGASHQTPHHRGRRWHGIDGEPLAEVRDACLILFDNRGTAEVSQ